MSKKQMFLVATVQSEYARAKQAWLDSLDSEDTKARDTHYRNMHTAIRMAQKLGFDVDKAWLHHGTPAQQRAYWDLWEECA